MKEQFILQEQDLNILDNLIEGYQLISKDWKYVYVNSSIVKQGKCNSKEEMLGYTMMEKYPGIEKSSFFKVLEQCMYEGISSCIENEFVFPDNTVGWFELRVHPMPNGIGILSVDITESKRAHMKLQETAHLLEIQNIQLVDFCNIISHNLRGPICNILMLSEFIEQAEDSSVKNEMFDKIKPISIHLLELVNELVESIQVKQDVEIQFDDINIFEKVDKILTGFLPQINLYNAKISLDFEKDFVIKYPRKYMDSIFSNLISNALKYKSPDRNPIIKINVQKIDDKNLITVSDNGLGIDLKMYKNKIFKIRQVFHEHPDAKGYGLFMLKNQIETMGGKIWVESEPNVGTTFYIEI